jgi:hypothetical protein
MTYLVRDCCCGGAMASRVPCVVQCDAMQSQQLFNAVITGTCKQLVQRC